MNKIRPGQEEDLPRIVELCEQKRIEYEGYSPYFWRKAQDSGDKQLGYLQKLIRDPEIFVLVAEEDSCISGFVIAAMITPPPVYQPGGRCCIVDDYNVSQTCDWRTVGKLLLEHAQDEARRRGAVLIIVVCAQRDVPKRDMLATSGLTVSSEWHVGKL